MHKDSSVRVQTAGFQTLRRQDAGCNTAQRGVRKTPPTKKRKKRRPRSFQRRVTAALVDRGYCTTKPENVQVQTLCTKQKPCRKSIPARSLPAGRRIAVPCPDTQNPPRPCRAIPPVPRLCPCAGGRQNSESCNNRLLRNRRQHAEYAVRCRNTGKDRSQPPSAGRRKGGCVSISISVGEIKFSPISGYRGSLAESSIIAGTSAILSQLDHKVSGRSGGFQDS